MAETQYVLTQTKQGKKEFIPLPTGGVAPHNQAWSTITDTPTTLAGYGITDGGGGSMIYPGAGIPLSTGSAWGTSYTTTGSGTVVALAAAPTFSGNVGIGASGDYPLDVNGYARIRNTGSDARLSIGGDPDSANAQLFLYGSTTQAQIGPRANTYLSLITNGTERQRILASGWSYFFNNGSSARVGVGGDPTGATCPLLLYSDTSSASVGTRTNTYLSLTTNDIERLRLLANGNTTINYGLHVGGTSDPGDNNLWIDGNAQEPNFISGWQGNNWQIQADGDAEFNNVLIRGGLSVYELIINQLHYQNGGLIIGAGAGKIATIVTATAGSEVLTFQDPEGNDMVPFTAGAIVMVQRVDISKTVANGYTGDIVKKIVRQVASVAGMEVTLTVTTGWTTGDDTGIFEVGDELCAIGHTTNTSLDSALYLSATDSDNPFLRVMDGVNSYAKWSLGDKTTCKLQLGNLASLASYDIIPASPGYGIYCDNAYLNGRIVLPEAGMTNEGEGADYVRIWAGDSYANRATAPFRVTETGGLYSEGYYALGTGLVGSGDVTSIEYNQIWNNQRNANSDIKINYYGYNKGTTRFRDLEIYDGKQSRIAKFDGVNGKLLVDKDLDVDGSSDFVRATFAGQATFNAVIKVANLASAPASPERGMIYVSSATGRFWGYNGTAWVLLDYNG